MPDPALTPRLDSRTLYLRLLTHVRPYWRVFLLGIVAMVVMALTEPAVPALLKPLLDGSFVKKDPFYIRWTPVALVALFAVRGAATYASTMAMAWVGSKVVLDLRTRMFDRLLTLPVGYYDDHPAGNIISKLTFNVTQVTSAATQVLTVLVRDTLSIIGLLAWMLWLDWRLTLLILLTAPAIVTVVKTLSIRMRHLNRQLQESYGDMTHVIEEAIRGNKVVKIFGGQAYERRRFGDIANGVRRYQLKVQSTAAINVPLVQTIAAASMGIIIYLAASDTSNGNMTVGAFMSFFAAMGLLFSPLKRLTGVNEHLQRGLAAAETIFDLIDESPERDAGARHLPGRARGEVRFESVHFRYPAAKREALRGIGFEVQPGETLALVGPSGSGKTTVANLLPRFYAPDAGRILLDGIDIQELPLAELRGNLSLVSQEIVLFNDTVAANIAYGIEPAPPREAIVRAAETAHAMAFIRELPEGLETLLGDNGVRLSGGQRQRIAIARALLKDPPVLILDEATAALDTQSEKHVQAALESLRAGRSTLVIAHRLSTVENADRILVMKEGCIVERGRHAELLALRGLYHQLYTSELET